MCLNNLSILDKSFNDLKLIYSDIDIKLAENYLEYAKLADCFIGMIPTSENIIKKSGGAKLW